MADVLAALEDGSLASVDGGLLAEKVESAVALLDRTLDLYGPSRVALSFNGGKDSTVLLHLLRAAVERRRRRNEGKEDEGESEERPGGDLDGVRSFTFERDDDFPEITEFVSRADAEHGLNLERIKPSEESGSPYANLLSALSSYLGRTGVAAVVLGTRRGDPNAGGQDALCASSPGWPPFLRVNPVLEWGYGDVWSFLDSIGAPYCSLYDRGFTSVGAAPTTRPNPALLRPDGTYAPARELSDGRTERAGRGGGGSVGAEAKEEGGGGRRDDGADDAPATRPKAKTALAPSAAIVLVGDELLSGRVSDANGVWMCRRLRSAGWLARRMTVVPDDVRAIASEVSSAARSHPVVLVAGGVGPTDDDVTAAGVSEGLRVPLARNADLVERLKAHFGEKLSAAHLKMADAPADVTALDVFSDDDVDGDGAERENKKRSPFPLLAVECRSTGSTVFILPGVPHLLRRKWRALEAHLRTLPVAGGGGATAATTATTRPPNGLAPFHSAALRLRLDDETCVAPAMAAAAAAGGAIVSSGSYPLSPSACDDGWREGGGEEKRGDDDCGDGATVCLLLESKDEAALAAAVEAALGALPAEAILATELDPVGLGGRKSNGG